MARVTVDDCMQCIPNRFQMTLAATYRARQITAGATSVKEAVERAFKAAAEYREKYA